MIELDMTSSPFNTVIKIIGVGGAGGNAINTMIDHALVGVEFIAANTDMTDIKKSKAKVKMQLGKKTTRGLGAGADPSVGREAALESQEEIKGHLEGADMVFIAAGMGGGTGTGAAPVIASIAKEMGILTLGIVSKPFGCEGAKRKSNADDGIAKLAEHVDTLIVIPNEKLREFHADMMILEAFKKADNVLFEAAKAVSDIINLSGYMNVDFSDVRTVMKDMGYALMGTGVSEGENRAVKAAKEAISNPLLNDISLEGCKALLVNITTGYDMKMSEFDEVMHVITNESGSDANIITGMIIDEAMTGKISVTIIATGLNNKEVDFRKNTLPMPELHHKSRSQEVDELNSIMQRIKKAEEKNTTVLPRSENIDDFNTYTQTKSDIPSFLRKFSD